MPAGYPTVVPTARISRVEPGKRAGLRAPERAVEEPQSHPCPVAPIHPVARYLTLLGIRGMKNLGDRQTVQ